MRKKTPETSKLTRSTVLPYTRTSSSDTTIDVAKSDKNEKAADKKSAEAKNETPAEAPKLGDGPKSATSNDLPTEPRSARAEMDTLAMPTVAPPTAPPEMPQGSVEDPTLMPGPRAIPEGVPTDAALPPGHVPPGDSRSFRRGNEFALVYRQANAVIMRFGTVGQRGQWRVVEYPTTASASHAYAKECSRFVADGFSDYR